MTQMEDHSLAKPPATGEAQGYVSLAHATGDGRVAVLARGDDRLAAGVSCSLTLFMIVDLRR